MFRLKRLFSKQVIIGLCVSSIFINMLSLVFPITLMQIYDRVIPHPSNTTLWLLISLVACAVLCEIFFKVARSYVCAWLDVCNLHRIGCEAFTKFINASMSEIKKDGNGAHLERLRSVEAMKSFYSSEAITAFLDLPFVFIYLGLIFYIGGNVVAAPIFTLILFFLAGIYIAATIKEAYDLRAGADERRINYLIEVLRNIFTIKSMGMEPLILRRYERLQQTSASSDYLISLKSSNTSSLTNFIASLNMILIVSLGSVFVVDGLLTTGGLAACTLLANRILFPLGNVLNAIKKLQNIRAAKQQIKKLTSLAADSVASESKSIVGKIELKDISFSHHERIIFNNLNFKVEPNETVLILPNRENGKSKLLSLILGMEKTQSGCIKIDDIEIDNYNKKLLREQISYIPQRAEIFNGTILENITFFRGDEYNKKAIEISEKIGLDKAIRYLPNGYETVLSNQSIELLPDGIRQRIGIAREFITEHKIVLFHEADSGIDIDAKIQLLDFLKRIKGTCSIVIVSPNPDYIDLADKIYQIQDHGLVEVDDYARQRRA